MFDLILSGGTVVDGTGRGGFRADVGISGERIEAIGDLSRAEAARVIDAKGLTVSPGFIDTHTHAEGALLVDPQHAYGLRQGITTELLGIDGMSYAPLSRHNFTTYRHWLGGLLGDPPEDLDMHSVEAFRGHYHKRVAVNTAYLVPFATIRLQVLGFHDKPLAGDDLKTAERLVREGLEQGAVGLTTGGRYYPGPWGSTGEVIALARIVRAAGKIYMCEPRKDLMARAQGADGVEEGMAIARASGVKIHYAHFRTQADTAGRIDKIMAPIDSNRTVDSDVTFDIYPYPTGSSVAVSLLPPHVQEGGPQAILKRLRDPETRRAIGAEVDRRDDGSLSIFAFTYAPNAPDLEGMRLRDLAARRGKSNGETLCDVLLEQNLKVGYLNLPPEDPAVWTQLHKDYIELLSRDDYMACSDITPAGNHPHPRVYGAFPRFLGRLRREVGTMSLEAMIHRMTDRPARRFGLTHRGRIEAGWFADVVIFDEAAINDNATYENPKQFPTGIPYVIVNGQVAVDNERCTRVFAGQAVP